MHAVEGPRVAIFISSVVLALREPRTTTKNECMQLKGPLDSCLTVKLSSSCPPLQLLTQNRRAACGGRSVRVTGCPCLSLDGLCFMKENTAQSIRTQQPQRYFLIMASCSIFPSWLAVGRLEAARELLLSLMTYNRLVSCGTECERHLQPHEAPRRWFLSVFPLSS